MTARQAEQERYLAEMRRLAAQRQAEGVEDDLPERFNRVASPDGNPPYQMAGRLAIYAVWRTCRRRICGPSCTR